MGKKAVASESIHKRGVSGHAGRYVLPHSGSALADALFTQTQQRVLGLVFGQPNRSFTVSEVIAASNGGSGAIHRELRRLAATGLVTVQEIGNQKRYTANPDTPIFEELVGIIRKTVAVAEPLRDALAPLADSIVVAFVFGSVAKGCDTANSDIDLMVVSDALTYADVIAALHPLTEPMGREINPALYTRAEFDKRVTQGNAFIARVLAQPKIWIFGSEHDFVA